MTALSELKESSLFGEHRIPDGVVSVSAHSLIQLHNAANKVPLNTGNIRAKQAGQYYSPFRGRGMEFDEVRPYQPGDDVRTLDWKVTARTGKAHTKMFREERERAVISWVDFRQPMFFATRGMFKSVLAAKTAALLAWSAHHQRDRVGGLMFSEQQHYELRPKSGKSSVLHLIRMLSELSALDARLQDNGDLPSPRQHGDSASACYQALVRLRRVAKPGSLVLLISDFRGFDQQAESVLTQISQHNNVILLFVHDPLEAVLPDAGVYRLGDGQRVIPIDTSSRKLRQQYAEAFHQRQEQLKNMCIRHRMNFVSLSTQDDFVTALQQQLYLRG
ncbi:MAG: DUF58 domain-containing protein [Gammaproteobacteria bacterium]|jgi:uncharacterized protein (DUF58 family)